MFITSALHKETNVGSLLLFPTTTTMPNSLFKIEPCATVCPPASTPVVPTGKYDQVAASHVASQPVGAGTGAGKYVMASLYVLLVIRIDAILHIEIASSGTPCAFVS